MLEEDISKLKKQYDEISSDYQNFCFQLSEQLKALLRDNGIDSATVIIEYRFKNWDSIFNNLTDQKYDPKNIQDIEDLVGVRVILLFKKDVEKVCRLLREDFNVFHEKDKQEKLTPDQFGYSSIHFLLKPPQTWLAIPTLKRFCGLNAEVQVRTAAQHIWANVSHYLSYKKRNQIPDGVLRALNRSSALLEIIDDEFSLVLNAREQYLASIKIEGNVWTATFWLDSLAKS